MKPLLLILSLVGASLAAEIRCTGVLGNSGGQGDSLVRFSEKTASGMGVAWDASGTLWDRGGDGRLNRYAVDGRLLSSYPLPPGGGQQDKDTLVICGDVLLMKLGKKLYKLPLDTAPGSEPQALPVEATRLSLSSQDGWAAAANDKTVFLVNAAGEIKPVAILEDGVSDIEIGPQNGIYAKTGDKMRRVDAFSPENAKGPWTAPGDRPQWIAERWLGSAWHGTLRRFGPDFLPDPGVVLGGASGSFIGYVEGNHELNDSRGQATLDGKLFAASGTEGVMHLMEWQPAERRFTILRRIGAIPSCSALAIDADKRVYFNGGYWEWTDGPDSALHHSVPPPQAPGLAGASTSPDGGIVAPGIRWGKPVIYYGGQGGPLKLSDDIPLPEKAVASAVVRIKDRPALIVVDAQGKGRTFFISGEGKYEGDAGETALQTTAALEKLTSLAALGPHLYAAADGKLIRFEQTADAWKETHRIDTAGSTAEMKFGDEIHIATAGNLIWVSDTARHRVLCLRDGKRIAEFGTTDRKNTDIGSLDQPRTIAALGESAVVFDSGNQRVLKLEIK